MTLEEFAQFLGAPPSHGYAKVTRITPTHTQELGVTNQLYENCEFLWKGTNSFLIVREGRLERNAGVYEGAEWDQMEGIYTKYAGTNRNDELRRRSPTRAGLANLQALGVFYYVKGSARLDGVELNAEVDIPEVREKLGVTPRLRGRFTTLPNGAVSQQQYTVYVPGGGNEGELCDYKIDYRFDGKWGPGFPSYIAVYLVDKASPGASNGNPSLLFETKIHDWDIVRVPENSEINPIRAFTNLEQSVIFSNDIATVITRDSKAQQLAGEKGLARKRSARVIIFLVVFLPLVLWGCWAIQKRNKQQIKRI
jgi:hypothetical protein